MTVLKFLRGAEQDLDGALTWYGRHGDLSVAQAFADDYRLALQRVIRFPRAGRRLAHAGSSLELRARHFKRFKEYYLVVAVQKRSLVLVAIAHTKRRYGYWKPRLAKVRR